MISDTILTIMIYNFICIVIVYILSAGIIYFAKLFRFWVEWKNTGVLFFISVLIMDFILFIVIIVLKIFGL